MAKGRDADLNWYYRGDEKFLNFFLRKSYVTQYFKIVFI